MEVGLELRPIQWTSSQGSIYVDGEWILLYSLNEYQMCASCDLVKCSNLDRKYRLSRDHRYPDCNSEGTFMFDSVEEMKEACEKHFRELMLKGFLQVI